MSARAIWKGVISAGDIQLPVKLYSAAVDREIRFHLLHDQDLVRLKQRMINPVTGKEVAREDIRKGYVLERDHFVIIDEQELAPLEPAASREIEITRFVDPAAINHQWYVRPYFLGPDGDETEYFAFAEALARQGKEGVAKWVMRGKQYVGALRAEDDCLMLITLHHSDEVISTADLEPPQGRKLDPKELDLASKLIAALEDNFDPSDYRNEHRDRVKQLIDAKRKGETVEVEQVEAPSRPASLAESLRASLHGAKRRSRTKAG